MFINFSSLLSDGVTPDEAEGPIKRRMKRHKMMKENDACDCEGDLSLLEFDNKEKNDC